jgi:hypothetical protein
MWAFIGQGGESRLKEERMRRQFRLHTLIGIPLLLLILYHPLRGISSQSETAMPAISAFSAQNSGLPAIEFVGSVGGTIGAIAVSNTTAYVGEGAALVIVDVANPLQPSQKSRLPLPDRVEKIQVVNNLVYVANTYSGLQIVDVQDPTIPILLGSFDTPGVAVDVLVADQHAYIADGYEGLHIVDVSDPTTPQYLGTYETGAFVSIIQLVNPDVAYLGDPSSGLFIIDVKDPNAPVLLNHTYEMSATDMQVIGDLAYLVGRDVLGLGIFDVSDPVKPLRIGNYEREIESAQHIWVEGGLAYIATYGTLHIIDVAVPSAPEELDGITVGASPSDLFASDGYVYMAISKGMVEIINAGDPANLVPEGQYATLGFADAVELANGIAYVADGNQGLQIIDVATPTHPIRVGRARNSRVAYDLAIKNGFAHVAAGNLGLQTFDVSAPYSPTLVASYHVGAYDIQLQDNLAYVGGYGEVQIFDVSNPYSLTLRGTYPGGWGTRIVGDVAYGLDHTGFQIVDVSNPDAPYFLGRYTIPDIFFGQPRAIAVLRNIAYLIIEPDGGLQIIDVSDPTAPVLLKTGASNFGTVHIAGDYMFAASGIGLKKMQILDVSTPVTLKPRSTYALPDLFRDIQLVNDLVYVADGGGGLQILRIHPDRFPPDLFLPLLFH